MAKNKTRDKLRIYYRGPLKTPTKVADEHGMEIISKALIECAPLRFDNSFRCRWNGQESTARLVIGLSAGLRHLKHRRTMALIFDDTASSHLANLLVEFSHKLAIPIIKAKRLIQLAPKLKLKTALVVSLVESNNNETDLHEENSSKFVKSPLQLPSFEELTSYLQNDATCLRSSNSSVSDKYSFKQPQLDHVKSTGKSRAKKETRAKARKVKVLEKGAT